jgi:hypothetical protein
MATDKSEPRVGLILTVGLGAVVTLISLRAALSTYFDFAVQAEELRKFGEIRPVSLLNLRAQDKERLTAGAMPIDKAMDQIARQGRKSAGPDFAPIASKDTSALHGWVKMPAEVPTAMEIASQDDAGVAMDGGVQAAPSAMAAGPLRAKSIDAGAPKTKP